MENLSSEEDNNNLRSIGCSDGIYKKFSLSDSRINSLSFLLPTSFDNDEYIGDIKQPSLSSANMTDSLCSTSTISSNFNTCRQIECTQEIINGAKEFCRNGVSQSKVEEDLQDTTLINEDFLSQSSVAVKQFFDSGYKEFNPGNMSDVISYRKYYTSTPLESLCANKKRTSISLQDVSIIDMFPLESKTTNAFSTETIQTQSMTSTTKSKDSGFQRSASCLSLNSGNRSYEHVQSKVKQYIKDIKESEAKRKKEKLNVSSDVNKNMSDNNNVIVNVLTASTDDQRDECITQLKYELQEKNITLNELQQNYNTLLGKYAEAVNQIDVLRLRSLNYDNQSDRTNDAHSCRNCSSLFSDVIRYSPINNTTITNNDNTMLPQNNNVPVLEINQSRNNNNNGNSESITQVVEDQICVRESDHVDNKDLKKINALSDYKDDLKSVDSKVNDKINDEPLREFSLVELQQPQSTSQSTSLNTFSSVKSTTLGPISGMYSSSSRLDKKISPLPVSSSTSKASKSNKRKIVKNVFMKYDDHCDDSFNDVADDTNQRSNALNSKPLVDNNTKVSYFSGSDAFEKVRMWQISLPTSELVRSHSSSSIESIENIDLEPKKSRYNSMDSKLKERKCNNGGFTDLFKDGAQTSHKHTRRKDLLGIHNNRDEQNVLPLNNCWSYSDHKNSNKIPKSVFKRSDAFDRNSEECDDINNVDNYNNDGRTNVKQNGPHSLMDDSTSLSSSILSSGEEVQDTNKVGKNLLDNKKKINCTGIENNNLSIITTKTSNIGNTTKKYDVSLELKTQSHNDKELMTSKKRVGFSLSGQLRRKTEDYEPQEQPFKRAYAWESPRRDVFAFKNNFVNNRENSENKNGNHSYKVAHISKNGNDSVILLERKEKLKRFTELLGGNVSKSFADAEKQMSDDEATTNLATSCKLNSTSSLAPLSYHQNLEEADAYVKYVIKEMGRIRFQLEKLQTSYNNTLDDGDSS